MFFYAPTLLLFGNPWFIIINSITAAIGVTVMAAAVMGFLLRPINWIERILLLTAGFMLIDPGFITDAIGLIIAGIIYINQKLLHRLTAARS